jgi:hypothetical protein
MVKTELIRQGDVLLKKINKIPKEVKLQDNSNNNEIILAFGEKTFHKHRLICNKPILDIKTIGKRYVSLQDDGILSHEEHAKLNIPKGEYEVVIQREFDLLGAVRSVMD